MATQRHKILGNLRGANKEAQSRYMGDISRRERASNILRPHEVSGEYDAGRMLGTTLGTGFLRPITREDLRAFRLNIGVAGRQFKGGITAKTVIDMSLPEDREKANKEIRTAIPYQTNGGHIHFITNASPGSNVLRHHVHIELLNYGAAVASPGKLSELAKFLATGPLKLDCDCGRHTFWFRYIATIGRFNAGREETGYPKIRNPELVGVACKHVLRVMAALSSPSIRLQLEKIIQQGRNEVKRSSKLLTVKEADELAKEQERTAHFKRNQIESSKEKASRLAQQRAAKVMAGREKVKAVAAKKATPSRVAASQRQVMIHAAKLLQMGKITQAQHDMMMSAFK